MPAIVGHGYLEKGGAHPPMLPCALCHLPNGAGHVESASLAGLSADYIVRQIAEIRSGARRINVGDASAAHFLAALKSKYRDDQVASAARYYASLKPRRWIRVVETKAVPRSAVNPINLMRIAIPDGGQEPIGERIVALPWNEAGLLKRDSHSGFIA